MSCGVDNIFVCFFGLHIIILLSQKDFDRLMWVSGEKQVYFIERAGEVTAQKKPISS